MANGMPTNEAIYGSPNAERGFLGALHELALGVLVLHDDVMDTDDMNGADLAKDLQELFPAVENEVFVSTPLVHVNEPTSSAWCIDPCDSVLQRAAVDAPPPRTLHVAGTHKPRRQRIRKRTDQEKKRENAKRYVQRIEFRARRKNCLAKERWLREYVREWIRGYAEAIGVDVVDESVVPFLPVDLQAIMARSNAATAAYCGFSGRTNLLETLNGMPKWW